MALKPFGHPAFDLPTGTGQPRIVIAAFFLRSRFKSVWSVCDAMTRNCCEQFLIQSQPSCWVLTNTLFDHGLKSFNDLHCSFEAGWSVAESREWMRPEP